MGGCMAIEEAGDDGDHETATVKLTPVAEASRKPNFLCLHGWRTKGDILSMQMAALQANTNMNCIFIDAPFLGRGKPDEGIAIFYPDRPYYEWFYRTKVVETPDAVKSDHFAGYDNMEESMKYLVDYIERSGPYDGLLGFSQGASMVTRLVNRQEELMKISSVQQISFTMKFRFAILIGGVPPQVFILL